MTIKQFGVFLFDFFIQFSGFQVQIFFSDLLIIFIFKFIINIFYNLMLCLFGRVKAIRLLMFIVLQNRTDFVFYTLLWFDWNDLVLIGMEHRSLRLKLGVFFLNNYWSWYFLEPVLPFKFHDLFFEYLILVKQSVGLLKII